MERKSCTYHAAFSLNCTGNTSMLPIMADRIAINWSWYVHMAVGLTAYFSCSSEDEEEDEDEDDESHAMPNVESKRKVTPLALLMSLSSLSWLPTLCNSKRRSLFSRVAFDLNETDQGISKTFRFFDYSLVLVNFKNQIWYIVYFFELLRKCSQSSSSTDQPTSLIA